MSNNWTFDNIPNLDGKVIIVTGANSGIGFESAKAFARKGAEVIMACRNMSKAESALNDLTQEIPDAKAVIMQLDLASLASVRQFVEQFKSSYARLDVLLNNAGIMWVEYGLTEDGFERQFGTNHLGHFALTGLLLDVILATPNARVVTVSSMGHNTGEMDWDNLMFENGEGYGRHAAYARSKLANLLFTYELQRRFEASGANAEALAAHPGSTDTNLAGHLISSGFMQVVYNIFAATMAQSTDMGALPSIRASVDPNANGGEYYGPEGFMEQRGYPVKVNSNQRSHNVEDAKRLWEVSEDLTDVTYVFEQVAAV